MAANGVNTVYESYIADLDPTVPDAVFRIAYLNALTSALHWNAASGRVYTVYWTSNLDLSGFQILESDLTSGVYTDLLHGAESEGFYKIEVELAP